MCIKKAEIGKVNTKRQLNMHHAIISTYRPCLLASKHQRASAKMPENEHYRLGDHHGRHSCQKNNSVLFEKNTSVLFERYRRSG